MVMHMWGIKAAAPMHSLHFGFGLGALLAPQIARPFLSPDDNATDTQATYMLPGLSWPVHSMHSGYYTMNTYANDSNDSPETNEDESRIEIPYSIVATFVLIFSFVVLAFYIKGVPKGFPMRQNHTRFRDMISPGSCTDGHKLFGVGLLTCLFFYFTQAVGGERAYGKFLFSFAIESDVQMSKDEASVLQSLFWLSFTTGRLLGIPLAKWIPIDAIIVANIIGNALTSTVLAIFAYDAETILWVFTCFMGFFISIVFPNGMSWSNLHLDMNSVAVMVLMVGSSCGSFIYQYMTGYLFENEGPQSLMYVMVGYSVALAASYVAMMLVAKLCQPAKSVHATEDKVEVIVMETVDK